MLKIFIEEELYQNTVYDASYKQYNIQNNNCLVFTQ